MDDVDKDFGNLYHCNVAEDENDLYCKEKDQHNHDTIAPDEETGSSASLLGALNLSGHAKA